MLGQETCKVLGRKGGERQLLLFEKTVLFLRKKGADQYKYKNHIMVGTESKRGREGERAKLYDLWN